MRSQTIFAVTAFLFLESSPAVAAGRPTTAPIQDEDIFALEHASDVQISPNGRFVAYVRSRPNEQRDRIERSIWLVDLATKEQRMLINETAEHPRWSPDSSRIAYLADDSEDRPQLFVIDTAGGATPKALTKGADAPGDAVWAPDGTQLIMTQQVSTPSNDFLVATPAKPPGAVWAPRPHVVTSAFYSQDSVGFLGPTHSGLAVVSAIGGEIRKVPIGDLDVTGALAWTPDGMSILFAAKPLSTAGQSVTGFPLSSLYELRRFDGSLRRLSRDDEAVTSAEVSRDGRYVAFVRHNGKAMIWQDELWVLDRKDGRSRRQQPSLDRAVASAHWTKDDRLLFSYGDAGESVVASAAIDGPEAIATRHADGGDFSAADDGSIGFALGSAERPTEAGVVRSGSGDLAVAPLNRELLHDRAVGRVATLRVLSSFDNETVPSFAILPPGYSPRRRYPTILWIHGGPWGDEGPQWHANLQLMAAAGYVVLYANPRGSTSYGARYTSQLPYSAPQHDFDDLMSVVDTALRDGLSDRRHLYVTGPSYGGIMTTWIVGKTARFRAAVAEKPAVNLAADELQDDQYQAVAVDARGLPWEHPDVWWRSSPISLVGAVSTPTMLIVGEDDKRTPPGEAQQFYDALQLRHVPSALVVYPGASHESLGARPSQLISKTAYTLAWFAKYK